MLAEVAPWLNWRREFERQHSSAVLAQGILHPVSLALGADKQQAAATALATGLRAEGASALPSTQ